ncbi:hypothetical protein MPRF_03410 [Mycolicibacterium parafortuitum]|uniref:T6SS Phospholipase effector Tle1-like catalytic domain-containing protein n=1 Tax=Mycolicibacterium parafortuitum TaxID=39692 RepID=A0A7I7TW96_MYCPF|nr:DUF2235 domain-containing protein [Mycolicibacterium parafortuitum]BBY73442.1 hypothetical protein MPRF_03410 [Mycolicibacterium parafortuitum]
MKNIALCFDRDRDLDGAENPTNAALLAQLLLRTDDQLVWSAGPRRGDVDEARAAIVEAYGFLVDHWRPGDRILLFGAGHGATCAHSLAQLLGAVGVLGDDDVAGWSAEDFRGYVLSTYVLPRTWRDAADWAHIAGLTAALSGRSEAGADVHFLGMFDAAGYPGTPLGREPSRLPRVRAARHALALDGAPRPRAPRLPDGPESVREVWFRGGHRDLVGGHRACPPLAGIALDWVLDGAVTAGAIVGCGVDGHPAPMAADALAGHAHTVAVRKVPDGAAVHASVQSQLRAHPSYWRHLPARVAWTDPDWAARAERLVPGSVTPPSVTESPALVAAS